jgi:peptidoglycan/LPS O-acetylase OafA/YrhL
MDLDHPIRNTSTAPIEPAVPVPRLLKYMPQLDGLRAIAVAMVVVRHYYLVTEIDTAIYGVRLFFVLSGFLITGILLASREALQMGLVPSRAHALRQFYIRRTLRIFPLYYLVVGVGLIVGVPEALEFAPWLLTYTLNWRIAAQGWYMEHYAHLWSLAVEEQFYLLWPWVILLVRNNWVLPSAIIMTLVGPLYRAWHAVSWTYLDGQAHGLTT